MADNEDIFVHDFDPSGDEHPGACMCPCCDMAEGKSGFEGEE